MGSVASPFFIRNGTVEALKWLALVLMTIDHVNKYIYGDKVNFAFALGRIAMPVFAFVLAYNLARPDALARGAYVRAMKHLVFYGLIATPFFIAGGGLLFGWWPLNIMFMLLAAIAIIYLLEKGGNWRRVAALAVFVFGGAFVEFWHIALAFTVSSFYFCKKPNWVALVFMVLSIASLYFINRNFWALVALPIVFVSPFVNIKLPRIRHLFYIYYPLHLAVIIYVSTL